MKIKLLNSGTSLPNCWKSCGASFEDWEKLQNGGEIEVSSIPDSMKHMVSASKPAQAKKGDK